MPNNTRYKLIIARLLCVAFMLIVLLQPAVTTLRSSTSTIAAGHIKPSMQIALIPLDSRPPCRDYPGQLAEIANAKVLIPPPGYLDYYKQAADVEALAQWLTVVGPAADAVVVSVDQLVHGGLLASRLPSGSRSDAEKVLLLLEQFHAKNPHIPIYAFNIIPRLYLAETEENKPYKFDMATYSILSDKLSLDFNEADSVRLKQLEDEIPFPIRHRYEELYALNLWLGEQLMDMTAKGTLKHVVLGQDDAYPFGLANMTKRNLQARLSGYVGNVTITRGTDEIAAVLTARIIAEQKKFIPHVYVKYSWPGASEVIMPYMPDTVAQTVAEKIAMVQGIEVTRPEDADFILYVHIGTPQTPPRIMQRAAGDIKRYLAAGRPVALVDLSANYNRQKNLYPYLEKNKIPLSNLVSYNGWNTASNSVGTAVAHAVINVSSRQYGVFAEDKHHTYLFQRILDDWYFQKMLQPELNTLLSWKSISPVSLGDHREKANSFVQEKMSFFARTLFSRSFRHKSSADGQISGFQCQAKLPWPRTFEVQLDTVFSLNPRPSQGK